MGLHHSWPLWLLLGVAACDTTDADKDTDTDTDTVDETDGVDTDDTDVLGETGQVEDTYLWPEDPEDYVAQGGTYVRELLVPDAPSDTDAGADICCRDWGAVSKNEGTDNALAALADGLAGILAGSGLGGVQEILDGVIEDGTLVLLFDHVGLPTADGTYRLGVLLGGFDDGTTYEDAAMGDGSFLIDPQSFAPGTGTPQIVFNSAEVTGGELVAEGGNFRLALGFAGIQLNVPIKDVNITATVAATADGVEMSDGELSGYLRLDDTFSTINDLMDAECRACMGYTGDFYTLNSTTNSYEGQCDDGETIDTNCASSVCLPLAGDAAFGEFAGYCGLLPFLIGGVSDIDLNSDTTSYEAISVGLRFHGVPAEIGGLLP